MAFADQIGDDMASCFAGAACEDLEFEGKWMDGWV